MLYLKKLLILFIFSSLLVLSLSAFVQARQLPYLVKTDSTLTISSDNSDFGILTPISETATTTLSIRYEYGMFARPDGFPFPNRKSPTSIALSVNSPKWCEVEIKQQEFEAKIGNVLQKKSIVFNTTISTKVTSESVVAFSKGKITINATAMKNGNIEGSNATFQFTISPDFVPKLNYNLSNNSIILKPREETNISLFVQNNGNSKIKVEITSNVTNKDPIIVIIPTDFQIDLKENKEINIGVAALSLENNSKKNISVCLNLTYYSVNDPSDNKITMCIPVSFDVIIDEEDFVDLTYYVIGIFAAFLILFIIISIIIWIRRRE